MDEKANSSGEIKNWIENAELYTTETRASLSGLEVVVR